MPPLAPEALGGLTGRLVTLGLVHGAWIGLLAASAAAIALRAIPHRRPRARYALLLSALGLAALGPPLATGFQRSLATAREATAVPLADAPDAVVAAPQRGVEALGAAEAPASMPAPTGRAPRATGGLHATASLAAAALDAAQPWLLAGWLLIFAALSLLLALGFRAAASLRRGASPAGPAIQGRSDDLARRLGLRRGPPVLVHPRLGEPCLCGLARPAILLPGRWLPGADDDRLDAILAHELAHARRFDLHVNFAQRLVESALFFHPAIHWLSRSIRRQRELCADAMAASLTGNPLALARALESVARLRRDGRDGALMSLGAPLGGDAMSLLPRIQELLGMTPTRTSARIWPLAALPASALIALLSASLGLAQTPPAPAPEPEPRNPTALRGGLPEGHRFDVIGEAGHRGSDRQICYEVRFAEIEADQWRNRMQGRLRPVEGEPEGSAWLLDPAGQSDLLTSCQESPVANITQAPKVTAFEGTHATIVNTYEQLFVADAKPIRTPKAVGFRPEAKAVTLGYTLDLSGDLRPGETLLGIDLRHTSLVAVHDLTRVVESPEGRLAAGYQVPTTIDRRCRLTAPIPEGSTLLVSLGLHERPGRLGGIVKAAVGLLEAAGSPSLVARGATIERLVLITPREIILEGGE